MSIAADGFVTPVIETGRVVNVNIEDWTIDVVSAHANKQFFDISVMMPYFHYTNGEGIYAVPEVGAMCWICQPSDGYAARPFILGFQAPHDEDNESFRCGRQSYNPGDMVMRTRDENFVIVRRGGVVQLGATPTCQRMYIPIQNVIRDFCENYELNTFGGELIWETMRDEETTSGDALTKFSLLAKQKADNPKHIAEMTIGSHGEDDPLTMKLVVFTDGTDEREVQVTMQITNDGDVTWDLKKNWTLTAAKEIKVESLEESITHVAKKNYVVDAGDNVEVKAGATHKIDCADSKVTAKSHVVDSSDIKWGSPGAVEPGVLGTQLCAVLNDICGVISGLMYLDTTTVGPIGPARVIGSDAISGAQGKITQILAQKVKLE